MLKDATLEDGTTTEDTALVKDDEITEGTILDAELATIWLTKLLTGAREDAGDPAIEPDEEI